MKISVKRIVSVAACLALAAVVGLVVSSYIFVRGDRVCAGVVSGGVSLSGMHYEQAQEALKGIAVARREAKVVITANDQTWSAKAMDLGVNVDWKAALEEVMQVGRRGKLHTRVFELISGRSEAKNVALETRCDPAVLRKTIDKVAKSIDRPATNASLNVSTTPYTVYPEKVGIKIDRETAATTISEALSAGQTQITLEPVVDTPGITAKDLQHIDTVLAQYTTTFVKSNVPRSHNLSVSSSFINKTILMPGDQFSFNKTVGERTIARGFRNAIIFVKGMLEDGVGGGICQVSSTLYNAALLSGMKIDERHNHSRTVVYVPAGRDATVVYGYRDLKFSNSRRYPVYISQYVSGNTLTAAIYGASSDKQNITVYNSKTSYTSVGQTVTVVDKSIPPGTTKVTDKGSRGVSTEVYRKIVNSSGEVKVELVSKDKYAAQKVVVATNPVQSAANQEESPAVSDVN